LAVFRAEGNHRVFPDAIPIVNRRHSVNPDPPQRSPVLLVVVGHQRDAGVCFDVDQSLETIGGLGFVIDHCDHGVLHQGERNRDDVGLSAGANSGEMPDSGSAEPKEGFSAIHSTRA